MIIKYILLIYIVLITNTFSHPKDLAFNHLEEMSNIKLVKPKDGWQDAYEMLVGLDILITDYSLLLMNISCWSVRIFCALQIMRSFQKVGSSGLIMKK